MSDQNINPTMNQQPDHPDRVTALLHEMLWLHAHDVDCTTCSDNMDCLAELVVAGRDPKQALPAIYAHIRCCHHCAEVYEALVAVLYAEQAGKLDEIER
jgi:hypothetical protein